MSHDENNGRIIGLLDMDCFECQIYQRDKPETLKKPCVVANSPTRIVSVNYEAKALGVSRSDTVHDAIRKCSKTKRHRLHVLQIPRVNGKPDSYKLRSAADEVLKVVESQCKKYDNMILQYSPSDEFYVDMTSEVNNNLVSLRNFFHTDYTWKFTAFFVQHIVFFFLTALFFLYFCIEIINDTTLTLFFTVILLYQAWNRVRGFKLTVRVLYGEVLMKRMCNEIYRQTKMSASAGISTNKFRAKLASSENKPNGISSILPDNFETLILEKQFKDVPGLKSGLGEAINTQFGISSMKELNEISEEELRQNFHDEEVDKILRILVGFDDSEVIPKVTTNSVSCRKTYGVENNTHSNIIRKTWYRTLKNIVIQFLKWIIMRMRIFRSKESRHQQNLNSDLKNLSKDIICRLKEERDRHSRETNSIIFEIKYYRNINSFQPEEESIRTRLTFNWSLKPHEIFTKAKLFLDSSLPSSMGPNFRIKEIGFTSKNWTHCKKN